MDIEVTQTLRRLVLLGKLPVDRAEAALEDCLTLFIERHSHTELLARVWQLRTGLAAHDATYVALAEGLRAPLVTCDGKLARRRGHAARAELIAPGPWFSWSVGTAHSGVVTGRGALAARPGWGETKTRGESLEPGRRSRCALDARNDTLFRALELNRRYQKN